MHLLTYFAHYVIARAVFDGARTLGVSPVLMIGAAVVFLVAIHKSGRHVVRQFRRM